MPSRSSSQPDVVSDPLNGDASDALDALVDRVRRLQRTAVGGRVVLGITGSPGAGKTTLAQVLVSKLNTGLDTGPNTALKAGLNPGLKAAPNADGAERRSGARTPAVLLAVHLPMDGFHFANATLDGLGLRERKGAIETFDGWGFVALLERIHRELDHAVYAPAFERAVDQPVAGEIAIEPETSIVVVEGNYLLSDDEPWGRVRPLLDEAWYCDTGDDERMSRLVHRHTEHGRSPEEARTWATEVDGANARLIAPSRARADLVVSGITWAIGDDRR